MGEMDFQIERWKNRLLDLGKQNRLINFRETKRGSMKIVSPDLDELFNELVLKERTYHFPNLHQSETAEWEVKTNKTITEQQHILKTLKDKAKIIMEEQGISCLFVAFGFLKWNEEKEQTKIMSPLVLVPVTLQMETITSPYELSVKNEEIIINPTLCYKLEQDYGVVLPKFQFDEDNILEYLIELHDLVSSRGWDVELECRISLFSYLKMNMYEDLEENKEAIKAHPILRAFGGDHSEIKTLSTDFNNYNHDEHSKPADTFQVVDADSSQQDAILYSKEGVSFVLQGPPGTGKSQTITNIIAEALATDKKVLFVSEKMAALEVVYKRLAEVGLSDFCLPLHSHKAQKKEVLDELNKTLHLDKMKLQEEAIYQLNLLQEHRKRLNQYAKELHTICQPLNQSIYEVNGRLAKLYMRPDVEFELGDVADMTPEQLQQYLFVLSEYEKALETINGAVKKHPWYQCKLDLMTHDLRAELQQKVDYLLPRITNLNEVITGIMKQYELSVPQTFEGSIALKQMLEMAARAPKLNKQWLYEENLKEMLDMTSNHQGLQEEYLSLKDTLDSMFDVEYENIDAIQAIELLSDSMLFLRETLNPKNFSTNNDVVASLSNLLEVIEQEKQLLSHVIELDERSANLLGIKPSETILDVTKRANLLACIYSNLRPTKVWFDRIKYKSNLLKLEEIQAVHHALNEKLEQLKESYDSEILTIDYEAMLERFEHSYHSVYKVLKKDYRKDMEKLRSFYLLNSERLDETEAIRVLSLIKEIMEQRQWIQSKADWMKRFLGVYYEEEETDFEAVKKAFVEFKKLLDCVQEEIPSKMMDLLIKGEGANELLKQTYYGMESFTYLDNLSVIESIFAGMEDTKLVVVAQLQQHLEQVYEKLFMVSQVMSLIKIPTNSNMPYSEGLSTLKKLKRFQFVEEELTKQESKLKIKFPSLYKGFETDWKQIVKGLLWIDEMHVLCKEYKVSNSFMEACLNQSIVGEVKETADYLSWCLSELYDTYEWLNRIFEEGALLEKEKLSKLEIRFQKISSDETLIEQWVAYLHAKNECIYHGLSHFIEEVEEMDLHSSLVSDTFLKRFYQLWLDHIVPSYPAVSTFGSRTQEDTRNDFDKLDVSQFSIARSRIRERLLNKLPDFDTSFSATDEIGILKRELNKKHKKMPVRQLFQSIPNLLLALKPCFMMSPLSVSLFLSQKDYQFDLVIFDEASQIRTEDAIGAMLRGTQVIIAGDSEQLPPTSFFKKAMEETESDQTSGVAVEDSFESILEEAQVILPERTLRWHYRSRHESLIAFSNNRIYQDNLITFPSTVEQRQHCGVEFEYVADGVYDRGGKKNNKIEAKRVAELVFEEIKRQPNRSLGVITFSETQQQAVDQYVNELRLQHPEYESFFSPDANEPFFIKNLENVQGDERDTIIFSVGYGKDETGTILMNFGPLSKKGGYRRLNVAITRAKYNIKLVSSILPEEMNVLNIHSEGVKMLHSYMEYARNHGELLKQQSDLKKDQFANAPFEESIQEYLESHGYKVATKVGCSGYRIDLAVYHPTKEGEFILGIECDGATYRSARTARERERLRQTVLKDMGWNIYRIWSTDWIKNPFIEGQKLLEQLEQSVSVEEGIES